MSSLLQQAVEHAQAGRRDEARRLLQQYLQTTPDNEVAWLWLASVAADQAEYQRALGEVLRINPANQQARALLDQFQRQYGPRPPAPPAAGPAPSTYAPPPPRPVGYEGAVSGVPEADPYRQAYAPPSPAPYSPYYGPMGQPVTPSEPQKIQVERVERRRGLFGCGMPGCFGCLGCGGCGQSCLLALVMMIAIPVVLLAALVLAVPQARDMADVVASYLPDDAGRKTVELSSGGYEVALSVPRSWYVAEASDDTWKFWRDMYNQVFPFSEEQRTWQDFESAGGRFTIVEANPLVLVGVYSNNAGGPVVLTVDLAQAQSGDFLCSAVRARQGQYTAVYEYQGGLCGHRTDTTPAAQPGPTFREITAPEQWTTVTFVTPVTATAGFQWTLHMPAALLDRYQDSLQVLIESVQIREI
jgi:tetratricopeptide (TPR) repeat protein